MLNIHGFRDGLVTVADARLYVQDFLSLTRALGLDIALQQL